MQYVEMGGVTMSRIVQGCYRFSKFALSKDEVKPLVSACIERGVTSFDTAEVYGDGQNEELMGRCFAELGLRRADIQIVSKTGIKKIEKDGRVFTYYDTGYDSILNACKGSLTRLGTDYIDLYLIHRESPMIDFHETAAALLELKKQGLVREIGVSNFDPFKFGALERASGGALVTNQIEASPCCFEHFNSGMMDVLVERRVRPMFWSPLAKGRLFTSDEPIFKNARGVLAELAEQYGAAPDTIVYAWLLGHPSGGLPITGSSKIERLDSAIKALELKLELYDWFRIYTASGQQVTR